MHKVSTIKRSLILVLSAASLSLAGCGNLPTASTAALTGANTSNLSTLSVDGTTTSTAATNSPDGHQGKGPGGRGEHGKGPGGFGDFGLGGPQMANLKLTDAQKTQIQALQAEAKTFLEANKPAAPTLDKTQAATTMAAARTAFEAAFKSDSFDPASLTATQPVRPVPTDAQIDFQVDQMIKLHDILTAEQRATAAKGPDLSNMPGAQPSPPADAAAHETQRLDKLATDLTLSEDQKTQLKVLFDAEASSRQADMEARKTQMDTERTALTTLLTAETVDRAALKALIQARITKSPDADNHLQQLVKIHDILTSEQRVKFLALNQAGPGGHEGFGGPAGMGQRGGHGGPGGPGGFGGHGGPGGPGGFGGHGGPGMGQPMVPGI